MTQTITAVYDNRADAERAVEKLVAAGISRSSTRIVAGNETASTTSYDYDRDDKGFWASLKEMFGGDEDRSTYTESLNRGGTLLTATVEDGHVESAMDIMEEHGSVDLDERESTWRKEGWTGHDSTSVASAGVFGSTRAGDVGTATNPAGATDMSARDMSSARETRALGGTDSESIPVVEERLLVGKRVADTGRVRLRSYVTETPVSEQVTLHDENVHVDRRTVDRAVTAGDEQLFAEKTIEAVERREEAVVSKEARVVEEVSLRKEGDSRSETVSDTVRKTDVEVEDDRGVTTRTGTSDSPTRRT